MDNTEKSGMIQKDLSTVPPFRSFRFADLVYRVGKKLKLGIIIFASLLIIVAVSFLVNVIEANSAMGFKPVGSVEAAVSDEKYYSVANNIVFTEYKGTTDLTVNVPGGDLHELNVPMLTVGEVISNYIASDYLSSEYEINLSLDTIVTDGIEIVISKIDWEEYVTDAEIEFEVRYVDVQTIPKGSSVVVQTGENARVTRTMKDKYVNGEYDSSIIMDEIVNKPAVEEIIYRGVGGQHTTSRGVTYEYSYYIDVTATAYGVDTGYGGDSDYTSTGTLARVGVIAVDPRVIPLRSKLYVESDYMEHGICYAEDIGGAITGNHIDVYLGDDLDAQLAFGVRDARVYVLE
jgi:Uncharacterized protein conserved in bacteria